MNQFETIAACSTQWRAGETRVASSRTKRLIDVAGAGLGLLVLAPLMLLVALAIYLQDRGPVFFRQRRTGLNGQGFRIYKFRTMSVSEDGQTIKQAQRYDSRVTRLGAVLRALSLDELPQLLNVLKGDMSLVGPRPHAIAHDELWCKGLPNYADRFRARPGLTGFAQVSGYRGEVHDAQDIRFRVQADNEYIDNWSVQLDLAIMLKTVPLLFRDARAY